MLSRWRTLPPGALTAMQAGACVLCLATALWDPRDIGRSEFRGGWLGEPLCGLYDVGVVALFLALPLTFLYRRTAAVLGAVGSFLGLPLYLDLVWPGLYRWLFPGEYIGLYHSAFVWAAWPASSIAAAVVGIGVFVTSARTTSTPTVSTEMGRGVLSAYLRLFGFALAGAVTAVLLSAALLWFDYRANSEAGRITVMLLGLPWLFLPQLQCPDPPCCPEAWEMCTARTSLVAFVATGFVTGLAVGVWRRRRTARPTNWREAAQ